LRNWSAQKSIQLIIEFNNFKKLTQGEIYQGRKACEKGSKGVIGLQIKDKLKNGLDIVINPSLLIKSTGNSIWGEYKYLPTVSKRGRRTTKEHQLDIALCSIPLEKFQQSKVDYGFIISSYKSKLEVEKIFINQKLKDKSIDLFTKLNESLKQKIPNITDNRKKCSICTWRDFCDNEAKMNGILTDIDGIGYKTAQYLRNIGISNIKQLARTNKSSLTNKLVHFEERDFGRFYKFIDQSKSYLSGLPIPQPSKNNASELFLKLKEGFFVFDIESNPDSNHDFLYGFLKVENINSKYEDCLYEPILNLINKNNKEFNFKILNKINSRDNWPILHYGETEKITIVKLAKECNLSNYEIDNLKSRFIDLHLLIRNQWILPIKNYSLKTVANWIGFEWTQKNVSGSKALFWWIQYESTFEDLFLKKILNYNKDDCIATLLIAKWFLKDSQ